MRNGIVVPCGMNLYVEVYACLIVPTELSALCSGPRYAKEARKLSREPHYTRRDYRDTARHCRIDILKMIMSLPYVTQPSTYAEKIA
jgi:hypothetical protein